MEGGVICEQIYCITGRNWYPYTLLGPRGNDHGEFVELMKQFAWHSFSLLFPANTFPLKGLLLEIKMINGLFSTKVVYFDVSFISQKKVGIMSGGIQLNHLH